MTLPPDQYRQMERHVPEPLYVQPESVRLMRDRETSDEHGSHGWLGLVLLVVAGLVLLAVGWGLVHGLAALQDAATPSSGPSAAHPVTAQSGVPHGEVTGRASVGSHVPVASSRESGDKGPTETLSVASAEESTTASPAEFDLATGGGKLPGGTPQAARTQVGRASWYDDGPGHYAAAPWWRFGMDPEPVNVCRIDAGRSDCTSVIVQDHCQCYVGESRERIIDLSRDAFAELAPLSVGIIRVQVDRGAAPRITTPPTDSQGGEP